MCGWMRQAIGQSFWILAMSALLALGSFAWRPDALPWDVGEIEIELSSAVDLEEALWVDARVDEDFEAGHLPGAVLLNEENWEMGFVELLEVWTPERPIVVYCSTLSCLRSHYAAKRLRDELGSDAVFSLKGGWEAMRAAGLVKGGDL